MVLKTGIDRVTDGYSVFEVVFKSTVKKLNDLSVFCAMELAIAIYSVLGLLRCQKSIAVFWMLFMY